ncbi:hypothetical protein FS837_004892 [Tulasnella sp. UAMH 9824]|nr:hypothetical protein FS837_004892 [Tulasnella sp. UAMH 9824]
MEDMIRVVRSVPSLKILLTKFDGAVSKEVPFSASISHQMVATWESSRNEFRELLNEACHPQFRPFIHWDQDVEQVTRVDDYIWVSFIVQDMQGRGSDLNKVQQAEQLASRLLREEDQVDRDKDIQTAMDLWSEPSSLNSLALLGDDSVSDSSSTFLVVGTTTQPNVSNEPSSSQDLQVPSSSLAEIPPLVPTINKNELEREADLPAQPSEAFGHAIADVSQLHVGSSNLGAPVSSNARQDRWDNSVHRQGSVDVATVKRSEKVLGADGRRPPTDSPFMVIHNLAQRREISMLEATFPYGPRHNEIWTSTITS